MDTPHHTRRADGYRPDTHTPGSAVILALPLLVFLVLFARNRRPNRKYLAGLRCVGGYGARALGVGALRGGRPAGWEWVLGAGLPRVCRPASSTPATPRGYYPTHPREDRPVMRVPGCVRVSKSIWAPGCLLAKGRRVAICALGSFPNRVDVARYSPDPAARSGPRPGRSRRMSARISCAR